MKFPSFFTYSIALRRVGQVLMFECHLLGRESVPSPCKSKKRQLRVLNFSAKAMNACKWGSPFSCSSSDTTIYVDGISTFSFSKANSLGAVHWGQVSIIFFASNLNPSFFGFCFDYLRAFFILTARSSKTSLGLVSQKS